jgi:hypothetical protein
MGVCLEPSLDAWFQFSTTPQSRDNNTRSFFFVFFSFRRYFEVNQKVKKGAQISCCFASVFFSFKFRQSFGVLSEFKIPNKKKSSCSVCFQREERVQQPLFANHGVTSITLRLGGENFQTFLRYRIFRL